MEETHKKFYSRIFKNINNTSNIVMILVLIQIVYQIITIYFYKNELSFLTFVINLFLIPATHHIKQMSYFYHYYLENDKSIYDE